MLRGRYGWLSQRNQFILPSPPMNTIPSRPSFGVSRLGKTADREKEGMYRTRTRSVTIPRYTYRATFVAIHTDICGNVERGWSAIVRRDSSGLMASLFGSIPYLLINRIAAQTAYRHGHGRLPCRPTFSASPRKIIPVKPPPYRDPTLSNVSLFPARSRFALPHAGKDELVAVGWRAFETAGTVITTG